MDKMTFSIINSNHEWEKISFEQLIITDKVDDFQKIDSIFDAIFFHELSDYKYLESNKENEYINNYLSQNDFYFIEKLKPLLQLQFNLLMSIYPIYERYNPNNNDLLNLFDRINLVIESPSNINLANIYEYNKSKIYDIANIYSDDEINNLPNDQYNKAIFSRCILLRFTSALINLVGIIQMVHKFNTNTHRIISHFSHDTIYSQRTIDNDDLLLIKAPNQLNICYNFLKDNYSKNL